VVCGVDQRPRLGLGDPHGDCASVVADVRDQFCSRGCGGDNRYIFVCRDRGGVDIAVMGGLGLVRVRVRVRARTYGVTYLNWGLIHPSRAPLAARAPKRKHTSRCRVVWRQFQAPLAKVPKLITIGCRVSVAFRVFHPLPPLPPFGLGQSYARRAPKLHCLIAVFWPKLLKSFASQILLRK
jgi:hypothetical protein